MIDAGDAPFFFDLFDAKNFSAVAFAPGAIHFDLFGHELAEVFIRSDHVNFVKAVGLGTVSKCTDDIVGLVTVEFEHRNAKSLGHAVEVGHGGGKVFGHIFAVGLIFGVNTVALRRCGGVEDDC